MAKSNQQYLLALPPIMPISIYFSCSLVVALNFILVVISYLSAFYEFLDTKDYKDHLVDLWRLHSASSHLPSQLTHGTGPRAKSKDHISQFRIFPNDIRQMPDQIHRVISHCWAEPSHQFGFIFVHVEIPARNDVAHVTTVEAGDNSRIESIIAARAFFIWRGILAAEIGTVPKSRSIYRS